MRSYLHEDVLLWLGVTLCGLIYRILIVQFICLSYSAANPCIYMLYFLVLTYLSTAY